MMHLGFGSTVFLKGMATNKLDGIGTYTKQLAYHLTAYQHELALHPFRFSVDHSVSHDDSDTFTFNHFQASLTLSTFLNIPFLGHDNLEKKIDLLHATDHYIPKLKYTPVIATIMDAIPISHPEWANANLRNTKNYFWKKSAKWAQKIITISDYSKSEIVKHFNINEEKIDVIPLGVNNVWGEAVGSNTINQVKKKYSLNDCFLVSVGTLQPRKNTLRLIQAFEALPKALRKSSQLIIVGRAGWGCNDVLEKIHSQTKLKNIIWLDYLNEIELRAIIQSATALIHPSLYEGFGLPILEAFAAGLPVVASNTTALKEVAEDTSITINPYDIESISDGMESILESSEDFRKSLINKGKQRAQLFSWENTAKQTLNAYKQTLKEFHGK